jgi:hypothetical protein
MKVLASIYTVTDTVRTGFFFEISARLPLLRGPRKSRTGNLGSERSLESVLSGTQHDPIKIPKRSVSDGDT